MARVKLEITKSDLQAAINKLESTRTFATRNDLWLAVEQTEWAKSLQPRPLKAPVVLQRVKELGIVVKTPPGKKGRVKGAGPVKRTPRSEKFARSEAISNSFVELRENTESKYHNLIDAIQHRGSLKAAVKLKCIECCCGSPKEVKLCTSNGHCSLWPFRPFQNVELELLPDKLELPLFEETEEAA